MKNSQIYITLSWYFADNSASQIHTLIRLPLQVDIKQNEINFQKLDNDLYMK